MTAGTPCLLSFAVLLLGLVAPTAAGVLVDTVGFTGRDRQVYGPALRYIANDTARGVHVAWKDGYGDIRYAFRPRDSVWRQPGGIVVNPSPRNLGCLAVDPYSGKAILGTDYLSRGELHTSRFDDSLPGAGRFKERAIAAGFRNLLPATARFGTILCAGLHNDTLFYVTAFGGQGLGRVGPFPSHSITGSARSSRFSFIWTDSDNASLYLKETPNSGMSWYETCNLSDSAPGPLTRSLLGGCAVYDSIRLYLAAGFYDGLHPNCSEIWLFAKYGNPPWSLVHRISLPDSSRLGDFALACCRPTLARNPRNAELYVTWEQFDPQNVDPVTGLCRADVWACRSCDSGRTWGEATRITQPGESSKRFPFLAEVADDTLRIICFDDQVAGFWEQGQGPQTTNPVLYLRIPSDHLPAGLAESETDPGPFPAVSGPQVRPAVSSRGFSVTCPNPTLVEFYDGTGRKTATYRNRTRDLGRELRAGVYFVRTCSPGHGTAVCRVIKLCH